MVNTNVNNCLQYNLNNKYNKEIKINHRMYKSLIKFIKLQFHIPAKLIPLKSWYFEATQCFAVHSTITNH